MKKVAILLLLVVVLAACGNGNDKATVSEGPASLSDLIQVFTDAGIEVDPNEQQMFQMVGAINGVMFYMAGNKVVKIYEYEDTDAMKEAASQFDVMKDWPSNGRFLLETLSEQAKELFASAK
ncbi:hypothetical protein [Cohnella sp. GCM10027633]|uniref:hypothetical protein n=1 Tax=unclassified Cohnella TaxID=2636738 RepID=UPI0036435D57